MKESRSSVPLVYACSGGSSAGQLANRVAQRLDRSGMAEMSCVAGVGGDVPSLVAKATSGRPVVVIDGCKLGCAKRCLERHGVFPVRYYQLSDFGIQKKLREDFDPRDVEGAVALIASELVIEKARLATA
jgi:uncharacterized metal-binding protein